MFQKNKKIIFASVAYLLFLLIATRVVTQSISCLSPINLVPTDYQTCNMAFVMDRFLVLALGGLVIFIIGTRLLFGFKKSEIIVSGVVMCGLLIGAYYLYMNAIKTRILNSPIYLDSLYLQKETP